MKVAGSSGRRRGLSLVETTMAMLVVGGVLVSALHTVGGLAARRRVAGQASLGHALAAALLDEVRQCRYEDPDQDPLWGRETGEAEDDRRQWDDVDDFDGLVETVPTHRDGTPLDAADGWSRTVTVMLVNPADPAALAAGDQGLKQITVEATAPSGRSWSLSTWRSRHASVDRPPPADTTYLGWIGVDLAVGGDGAAAVSSGVAPLNSIIDGAGGP